MLLGLFWRRAGLCSQKMTQKRKPLSAFSRAGANTAMRSHSLNS